MLCNPIFKSILICSIYISFQRARISPPLPPREGKGGKLRRKWNEIADGIYKNLNEKNRDTSSWKNIQFHSEIIILRTRREQDTVSTLKYVTFQVRPFVGAEGFPSLQLFTQM